MSLKSCPALINVKYSSFKGRDRKAFSLKHRPAEAMGHYGRLAIYSSLHGDRLKGNTKLY